MADPYLRERASGHVSVSHAEREMAQATRTAITQYLQLVTSAVLDGDSSSNVVAVDSPDMDRWPRPHLWRRIVRQVLRPVFDRIWRRAFNRHLSREQRSLLNDEDYIAQHLDDFTQRITGATWPDEVYDAVREQISEATALGETLRETRRRVRQVLGPDQWKHRADTIARTESLAALNGGAYRAGRAREEVFDEQLHKRWIATDDARTRPTHREADGQTVPADEPFSVGGESLQFPHDPTATAGETINCRCVMNWYAADEIGEGAVAADAAVDNEEGNAMGEQAADQHEHTDVDETAENMPGNMPAGEPAGEWTVPGDDEVTADQLVVDGEPVTVAAGDFTPSGAPTQEKRDRAEKSGAAMKGGRFPIENRSDLRKAIYALGRAKGGARGRAAVKAHIVRRAKKLGLTSMLPEDWTGSTATAAAGTAETSWYERVAESVPDHAPRDWFTDPELTGPTKIRVTDQGRVYGHIAAWDTEHASLPGVTARMFQADTLHRFHRHPVRTGDGGRVLTGPLATGGHASTDPRVGLTSAQSHYDQPEYVAADVAAGKDRHGIWVSGSLRPGASPFQVMMLDRYSMSGDWRNGELVAACAVSVPGFHLDTDDTVEALAASAGPHRPVLASHRPRAEFDDTGYLLSLVAAGVVTDQSGAAVRDGWELFRQFQAAARADQQAKDVRRRINQLRVGPLLEKVSAAAGRRP